MSNTTFAAALLGFVLLMIFVAGTLDHDSNSQDLYCEMTAIYKETNGQYGWPEYKENVKCQ